MNYSLKKILSKTVLTGLIVGIFPIPFNTNASQKLTSFPSQKIKIPTKISKQEIDKKIAIINKTIKGLRIIKYIATGATIGVGGLAIGGSIAVATIIAAALPTTYATFGVPVLSNLGIGLTFGIVTAIASGSITAQATLALFGGLSASMMLEAFVGAKILENIEKNNPGILTVKQKQSIEKLKNISRGPILAGLVKGLKLKEMYKDQAKKAIQKNPQFKDLFGNENRAFKTILYYIKTKLKMKNLQGAINKHEKKIKEEKESRDKHNKWTPIYHFKNSKLIALKLDLTYGLTKKYLSNAKKNITKILSQYPEIKKPMESIIRDSIKKVNEIMMKK